MGMLLVYNNVFWAEECRDNIFAHSDHSVQGFHSQIFGGILWWLDSVCFGKASCGKSTLDARYMLNLKKCLFYLPFGILLGHVVCKQGLMVDPTKIVVIINLEAPRSVKQLCTTLGHRGYYRKFIKSYAQITTLMEKLLKKDVTFYWNEECQKSLDVLKEKMVTTSIP